MATATTPRFQKIGSRPTSDVDQFPITHDTKTLLMWDRREFEAMNFKEAQAHIATLNKEKFGGHNDWRLPECDELLTLVDRTKHSPAIDTDAFPNCKHSWYWSGTPYAYSPADFAWSVSFYNGSSLWLNRSSSGFVRAVRVSQ